MRRWSGQLQGIVCFFLGAAIVIHETLLTNGDRPYILTAALALMGFPFVLGFETKSLKRESSNGKEVDS